MKTSTPRTFSLSRTKSSPSENRVISALPSGSPISPAIASASGRFAVPEKSTILSDTENPRDPTEIAHDLPRAGDERAGSLRGPRAAVQGIRGVGCDVRAGAGGLEPPNAGSKGRCLIHLTTPQRTEQAG